MSVEDGYSLDFLLVVIPAFLLGKVLVALGLLTEQNSLVASRWAAGIAGIVYAVAFTPVRTFGLPIVVCQVLAGTFAGGVAWLLIVMGFLWALPKTEKKREHPRP